MRVQMHLPREIYTKGSEALLPPTSGFLPCRKISVGYFPRPHYLPREGAVGVAENRNKYCKCKERPRQTPEIYG